MESLCDSFNFLFMSLLVCYCFDISITFLIILAGLLFLSAIEVKV